MQGKTAQDYKNNFKKQYPEYMKNSYGIFQKEINPTEKWIRQMLPKMYKNRGKTNGHVWYKENITKGTEIKIIEILLHTQQHGQNLVTMLWAS